MTQYPWPDDDETYEVTYSTLVPDEHRQIPLARATLGPGEPEEEHAATGSNPASPPLAATPAAGGFAGPSSPGRGGADDPWQRWQVGEHRPVSSVRGAWPLAYRRTFRVIFCGALLGLGMLLGTLFGTRAPGQALAPLFRLPAVPSARHGVGAPPNSASGTSRMGTGTGGDAPASSALSAPSAPDARFAIATLSVHCMLTPCDEAQFVAAGQRIYPRQGGVSCTTTGAVAVVGHGERYVYCRLDQPNVFTYTFDGAQFDCVGSWLGCHTVVVVDTTNGR